jgi:hypothetical protein
MKPRTQRRTVGAVLSVPLDRHPSCFAVTLPEADFAFYRPAATRDIDSQKLFTYKVLFRVPVHESACSTCRWSKVAKLDLPPELLAPQPTFIQDAHGPRNLQWYIGGVIRPATRTECEGLERAAVWEPAHVEQRLRDHLAGVPCVWVEQLRLR